VLKNDLQNLSRDVRTMFSKMNESLKGFSWVVSEKLQDIQEHTDDVNGTLKTFYDLIFLRYVIATFVSTLYKHDLTISV